MSSLCEILFGSKKQEGIFSVCTANPVVIRSALRLAKEEGFTLAVEATANQVDQFGGYTGMRPADYAAMVEAIAADEGVPADRYILGGDHLGPLTRCGEPEEKAMPFAKELVRQYVLAGFTKIHLDTSMRLASDDQQIPLDVRVAGLCRARQVRALIPPSFPRDRQRGSDTWRQQGARGFRCSHRPKGFPRPGAGFSGSIFRPWRLL